MQERCRLISESQWHEYQRFKEALYVIEANTGVLGGSKQDLEHALLNISKICYEALENKKWSEE